MAFWGIEVKPGKPVKHSYDKVQRRLRISQATLGIGSATKTSFVQCNVGNKHPVFLCALLPCKTESCHLDLEFEEPDDVVFSVLGPRSVYLTGYYVNNRSNANFGSDTESYGEDIAGTESEKSGLQTDDDEYDDSFIDDDDDVDDLVASPASALPGSFGKDDEKSKHSLKKKKHSMKKTKGKNDTHNPQRRKFVVVDSDDDAFSQHSEENDNYLLSVFNNKKAAKASASNYEKMELSEEADGKKQDSAGNVSLKKRAEFVNKHKEPDSEPGLTKKKKLKRKRKEETDELKSLGDKDVNAQLADAGANGQLHGLPSKENKKPTNCGNIDSRDNLTHPDEVSPRNKPKPKKRTKVSDVEHILSDNIDGASSKNAVEHLHHEIEKGGKRTQERAEDKKTAAERDTNTDLAADEGIRQITKKKKKKVKSHENSETLNTGGTPLADNVIREPSKATDVTKCDLTTSSSQVKTLSNGLVVEDLSFGDKEGKVAAMGKKVKIFYSAMLKENGQVLDSNIGKTPYRFRLGDEGIIEGWNVGMEGMHVGDKRRLTIPPSMGYGSEGGGENIPPNSWLVYDVELISVR